MLEPLVIRGAGMKYEPVDTSPKFTAISLVYYCHTTGLIMRSQKDSILAGYCNESPKQVLEVAFPRFHITSYKGFEFFGSGDFEQTTPMVGLAIGQVEPVFGIDGKIADLLKLKQLSEACRKTEISSEDVERIITHTQEKDICEVVSPEYKQVEHTRNELFQVLNQYLGQRARIK